MSGRWYGWWSGAGSDIGELAIAGAIITAARRAAKRHIQHLAVLARHHVEQMHQRDVHHQAHLELAARQHQEALDRADVNHQALRADMNRQHGQLIAQTDTLAQAVADAQARGGAGGNPAVAGLAADQRVVPPPATTRRRKGM